jgi:mannosyltransferase
MLTLRLPAPPSPATRIRIGFLALMLIAFVLRAFRLDGQSLWYDEAVTAQLARSSPAELTRWTANDIQPPLYYYIVSGWGRLAGWSEWSLRWPSLVFGVLLTPLLAVVARRLTRQPRVALLAALLAALHPLLLYYSQEARMYSLLLALSLLAVFSILRGAWLAGHWRFSALYVLAATAAIYTHYFALFLLVALVLAFWPERPRTAGLVIAGVNQTGLAHLSFVQQPLFTLGRSPGVVQPFVLTNLVVLLLYLPWLGALLNRLALDRSYWQGGLKLDEALRSVAIHFTSGETMRESPGLWLLLPYGLVTVIAVVRLIHLSRRQDEPGAAARQTLRYALLWVTIPVIGVLTLAWFAPKFSARYVLLALPGLLILWSAGLAWPAGEPATARLAAILRRRWQLILSSAAVIWLVVGALWSNGNWFFDRAFQKDDWRSLAAFLRPRLDANETVILVSGHAAPVWNYYAPDIPALRLPAIEVLDVDAVLSFANTVEPLRTTFAETTAFTGAWVVLWQDEVVDPAGIVPVQLELAGREKGQSSTFWGLTVRRFSNLRPHRFVEAPPITQPLRVDFGEQLTLLGYHVMEDGDLLLFWQRPSNNTKLAEDYHITGETVDAQGRLRFRLSDRRPAAYTYPVARWRAGEVVMGQIQANDWLGPSPEVGTYTLHLTVYGLHDGQPQTLSTSDGATVVELPVTIEEFD